LSDPSTYVATYPRGLYSALLRVRPAQLCDLMKRVLCVRRMQVQTTTGHQFWIDPVSILGLHLLRDGAHEEQMTRLVQLLLRPSDVFIDIGANEGYFSVLAASQVPDGAVHSIEPQARLQEILKQNCELNGSNVMLLHQTAISNRDGHMNLYLRPSTNTGASSIFRHWKLGSRVEQVVCTTLDSFFDEHSIPKARLIKVDCEGAESLVVEGAKNVLAEHRVEFIAMEYHHTICGVETCRRAHQQMIDAGYILTTVSGQCIYHLPSFEKCLQPLGEMITGSGWPG